MVLAVGLDDHHLVLGALEADLGARDVVEDDRVRPLALELLASPLEPALDVSAAKPTIVWPSRPARAEAGEDVLGRLEVELEPAAALAVDLLPGGRLGAEVGRGRGHHQDVGRVELAAPSAVGELGGGLDVDPPHAGRRRQRDVGGDQGHLGAAPGGALGERQPHPAAGAVADEADRVDRLAGAAGGDQHPQAVPGAARARQRRLDRVEQRARLGQPARRRARPGRRARPPRARSP